jgi:hypothetical protein
MLIQSFISHQWKQAIRSTIWQKSLAMNIFMFFIGFILFAEVMVLSIFIGLEWHEITKGTDPLNDFFRVVAYYFSAMFVMRFLMQQLPVLEVRPYLHLPVKKKKLLHYILGKGLLNFFNLISIIFFTPFAFAQIGYYHGALIAIAWLLSMIFIDLTINYIIIYIKKQMVNNLTLVSIMIVVIGLFALGDYLKWFSYSSLFAEFIGNMIKTPVLFGIPIVTAGLVYWLNFRFLSKNLYIEDLSSYTKKSDNQIGNVGYLKNFGVIGEIIAVDIKLYLRNKRTKSMLYLSPLFLAYGLMFYPQEQYERDGGMMIFVGIFMTGILMVNYLQYAFAYEGSYFDMLLTSGINFKEYIRAKFITASVLVSVSFILTLPYFLFGREIFFINTACFLFNLGIVIPIALYFATYNKKSLDLKQGSAFNYQGVGASHWLFLIPFFIGPMVIYLPFKWFGNPEIGLVVLGSIGLISLAFRQFFIRIILKNISERKYIMAAGFRERG